MGSVQAKESPGPGQQIPLGGIRAKVVAVNVEGLKRTKDDIVMASVKDLFNVEQFEELVLASQEVRGKLEELGCFSKIGIHIDTSSTGAKDYVVTFDVEESKRVAGSVNTLVGNNEGSLMTGLKLPNLLGRGEKLQADYTYGSKRSSSFNISLLKPIFGPLKSNISGNIFQAMGEQPASGFKQLDRGFLADLSFLSAPQVVHNLQYEAVWRNLSCLNKSSSFAVREQAGHTLKSAIRHILCVDRRDNAIFPTEGTLFRLSQEFAGLGGNIGFFKNEVEVQANVPLGADISVQASLNAGMLKPDQGDKTINISDNFFLGGPMNIRGFDLRGVGPHSDGNSLGGTMYWATGLHIYGPLPFRPGRGGFGDLFRTHLFMNAGNVGSFNMSGNMQRDLDMLAQDFRLSYGLGLAVKLGGIARIELNYCIPVKASRGDKVTPGLQFGVGVNFL